MHDEANQDIPVPNKLNKRSADGEYRSIFIRLFESIGFVKYFIFLLYRCRISLISSVIGIFILLTAPQARDLFLEVRSSAWPERLYWTAFYFLLIFAWLLPVYFSALYMIEWGRGDSGIHDGANGIAKTKIAEYMRKLVPLILVFGCLLALGYSQLMALNDFKILFKELKTKGAEANTAVPIPNMVLLIQATMLAGALFLTSRAELAFEGTLTRKYFFVSIGLVLSIVIVWFSWLEPYKDLFEVLGDYDKKGFLQLGILPLKQWIRLCYPLFIALLWIFIYAGIFRIMHRMPDREDTIIPTIVVTLLGISLLLFVEPFWLTSRYVERALLLPVVLGVWVPIFSLLSITSARTGFPFVISFLVLVAIFWMMNKAHDVRADKPITHERLTLNDALDRWKAINGCPASTDGKDCPPLVLIATQGGASRSAFFTGAVLGEILKENGLGRVKRIFAMSGVSGGSVGLAFFAAALRDSGQSKSATPCQSIAKLATEEEGGLIRPGFQSWFRAPQYSAEKQDWLSAELGLQKLRENSKEEPYNESWRACLEVLAAGDFLSPVFLRMSGVDFLGLNWILEGVRTDLGDDRSRVLEKAWEARYQAIVGTDLLGHNFLDFGPDPAATDDWKPLLLLNATSTADGRRITASHLYPAYCDGNGWRRRIFNDTYDLHEVFSATRSKPRRDFRGRVISAPEWRYDSDDCKCMPVDGQEKKYNLECKSKAKYDIKLSTAASLSSRFPLVSTQADLKALGDDTTRARVADGGYFENFGATTLFDLVTAIRWLQEKLPIHVLLITNDPTLERSDCLEGKVLGEDGALQIKDQSNQLPSIPSYQFGSGFRSIFDAALQTRSARGSNAAINLCKLQWASKSVEVTFSHIRVKPPRIKTIFQTKMPVATKSGDDGEQIRNISMSWWLSYPLQFYLDHQVDENAEGFKTVKEILSKLPGNPNKSP
jgi:hypothetical protein